MDSRSWLGHAEELASLLVTRYTRPGQLLAKKVDCSAGRITDDTPLIDELGDYVQYAALLGKKLQRQDLELWAHEQAAIASHQYQLPDGLFAHGKGIADGGRRTLLGWESLLDRGDTMWGLVALFLVSPKASLLAVIERAYHGVRALTGASGLIPYGGLRIGQSRPRYAKLPLAEPMTTGYFAEPLIYLHQSTGDGKYLEWARAFLLPWLACSQHVRYGLFRRWPIGVFGKLLQVPLDWQFRLRGRPGMKATILVKGDTYLVLALLALYRVTQEDALRQAILHWRDGVSAYAKTSDGRFHNHVDPATGTADQITLGENHSVVEALLDIAHDLHDQPSLDLAQRCAEAWLGRRSKLGLIADCDGRERALLDPQVDFAINLLKLAYLSRRSEYKSAAFALLEAVLSNHRLQYGLAGEVNSVTGEIRSSEIDTKFLGLLVKALLAFTLAEEAADPMSSKDWRFLTTDR